MRNIPLGPAPSAEARAQYGASDYTDRSRRECRVYTRMLQRFFPVPDGLAVTYFTCTAPFDDGLVREVVIRYPGSHAASEDFAQHVELNLPSRWDATALNELHWYERRDAYQALVKRGLLPAHRVPKAYQLAEPPNAADDEVPQHLPCPTAA